MRSSSEWEGDVYGGLEQLDGDAEWRASLWGHLEDAPDEPRMMSASLPVFEVLDFDLGSARLA